MLSSGMARKMRVQYPGAIYHVMNRGDHSEVIFRDERDPDMFIATLAEACGIPAPAGLDGSSLIPVLHEPAKALDTTVYSEFALGTPNAKYMIRRGDFKYSFYVNDSDELYNLRADPQEMRNLASLPEHKGRVEEMKAHLLAWSRG